MKTQNVNGYLYQGEQITLGEDMPKGSTATHILTLKGPAKFLFPWTKELWQKSQIPAKDFMGPDWFELYSGAWAAISGSSNCAKEDNVLSQKLPSLW